MELFLLGGRTHAALLDYKFTVTQPLQYFTETIGGPTTPIIFDFVVDAHAPNLNPPEGMYAFGYGLPGYGSVTVGSTVSMLEGGGIQVNGNQNGDVFNSSANGYDTGVRIGGRSLFVSAVSLFDPTGQIFTGIDLPTNVQSPFAVYFSLTFRPGSLDLNQNDYIKFDAFVLPDNYTGTVSAIVAVPLRPSTWPMMILGLAGLGFIAYRRRSKAALIPA